MNRMNHKELKTTVRCVSHALAGQPGPETGSGFSNTCIPTANRPAVCRQHSVDIMLQEWHTPMNVRERCRELSTPAYTVSALWLAKSPDGGVEVD